MSEIIRIASPLTPGARARLYARATHLALLTIGYNLIEGLVSVFFGLEDGTVALFGFGLDSFVEVISGVGIWHMMRRLRASVDGEGADEFEKTALRVTGAAFYLLTIGLVLTAAANLLSAAGAGDHLLGDRRRRGLHRHDVAADSPEDVGRPRARFRGHRCRCELHARLPRALVRAARLEPGIRGHRDPAHRHARGPRHRRAGLARRPGVVREVPRGQLRLRGGLRGLSDSRPRLNPSSSADGWPGHERPRPLP